MPSRRHSGTVIATAFQVCNPPIRSSYCLLVSGTHARTQGLVKGKLIVEHNLPKHLKQSLFADGGEYPVACRYSSEPGDPGLDVSLP